MSSLIVTAGQATWEFFTDPIHLKVHGTIAVLTAVTLIAMSVRDCYYHTLNSDESAESTPAPKRKITANVIPTNSPEIKINSNYLSLST